ncbi:MAG TPA: sialidase family protein [Stellaceae bacterium]|jgi:hypothetical protein|nr:sialidase family protein [Stellaceae bacterium]
MSGAASGGRVASPVAEARHRVLFKDPFSYCAHPHIAALPDGDLLMVFNRAPRRHVILHPPQEPLFYNVIMRSSDGGESWSAPQVAPDYDWHGVECAGLTALADGGVMLNQWRFRWYPLDLARKRTATETLAMPSAWVGALAGSLELDSGADLAGRAEALAPWARGGDAAYVHLSADGGRSFETTIRLDTTPFVGGYGMRGAARLPGGELVLPLCDIPAYQRIFVVRSSDGGRSWGPAIAAAALDGRKFEEPAPLALPDGRIVMLLRENVSRRLWQVASSDGGLSWNRPEPTPIDGYPGHLLALSDGRILCVYGHREPDFSIRAVQSMDGGRSWSVETTGTIRGALPNKDLGYPSSVQRPDGTVLTVYYAQEDDGVTSIQATWSRP